MGLMASALLVCSCKRRAGVILRSVAALFGVMIGGQQPLVGQDGEIMDFWADVIGMCFGWGLAQVHRRLCRGALT